MGSIVLVACVLVCPLGMVAMRIGMRGGPPHYPRRNTETSGVRKRWLPFVAVGSTLGIGGVLALTAVAGVHRQTIASTGIPSAPDYHSLLVDPLNPRKLMLGTHLGLFVSSDGGVHWRADGLAGDDAMNLAQPSRATIWLAGHDVFKRSRDSGRRWMDVRPTGLPSLDIHAFAVDPRNPKKLWAAIAGQGLYTSVNGGGSFRLVSRAVGGSVMALAVLPDGRILAGDMGSGLLESRNQGRSWAQVLRAQLMGLAVNPRDPRRLLATGPGIALSINGGATWCSVLNLAAGAGPVAWSKSDPKVAYVVGFDRSLYRTTDGGRRWQRVGGK